MIIDRLVNLLLAPLNIRATERRIYFHSQNPKTVANVLKSRRKYDGDAMAVYPPPSVRAEARATV